MLYALTVNTTCRMTTDINDLFDWVEELVDTEEAINVCDWADLALVDSVYEGDGFEVALRVEGGVT